MPKKSLVSYDSEDEDLPTFKKAKNNLPTELNQNQPSQNCPTTTTTVSIEGTNFEQKYDECNQRLIAAEKEIKKLRDELFENGKRIIKLRQNEFHPKKEINILKQTNERLTEEAKNERNKYLEVSIQFKKFERNVETEVKDLVQKEMRQREKEIQKKETEFEEYKTVAEKFIAKADAEKEVEAKKAEEAEAKIGDLEAQISSLKSAAELKNVEMAKLQAAYDNTVSFLTNNNTTVSQSYTTTVFHQPNNIPSSTTTVPLLNTVPPPTTVSQSSNTVPKEAMPNYFEDGKISNKINKEAKKLFTHWRDNYIKNKNGTMEFQISELKKKLQQSETEKQKEIKNSLNYKQRINLLENERSNFLSTIGKQKSKIYDMEKRLNGFIKMQEQQKKEASDATQNKQLMKEITGIKENITELIQKHNTIILSNNDQCSAAAAATTTTTSSMSPKWIVPEHLCTVIWKRCNKQIKPFLEEYNDRLFSLSEQLLPEKMIENSMKWHEAKAILEHFFKSQNEIEAESKMDVLKEVMCGKRYKARSKMYRNCSADRLCAITSTDKIFYYFLDEEDEEFYLPYSDQECQNPLNYKVFEDTYTRYGIPKEYQSCPFIIIVKDDEESQQIIRMDCTNGTTKIAWERKKNYAAV